MCIMKLLLRSQAPSMQKSTLGDVTGMAFGASMIRTINPQFLLESRWTAFSCREVQYWGHLEEVQT